MAGSGELSATARRISGLASSRVPDASIVVALSGGADSAVLAWAVSRHRSTRAVSVDHGLPGSAALMTSAAAIAVRLGLDHVVIAGEPTQPTETAFRVVRYAALSRTLRSGELLATGHTLDDQAETVLGNVLRGTGPAGLAGIPWLRGRVVRPLLEIERRETRAVARELRLPFADDPQNDDDAIRRNRLRHRTIPQLAADYNPRLVQALGRLAAHADDDDRALSRRAERIPVRADGDVVRVPAASLATLPAAIAARVARRALRLARGPHPGTADEVAAVLGAAVGERSTIGGGIDVDREGPWVVLSGGEPPSPEPRRLRIGDETRFGDWTIGADREVRSLGAFRVAIPLARRLEVRSMVCGDRIGVAGGSKPVAAAMAEAGVPRRLRPVWPLVEADGSIVWIPGVRAAPVGDEPGIGVWARRRS